MESDIRNMEKNPEEVYEKVEIGNSAGDISNEMFDDGNSQLPSADDMKIVDITPKVSTDVQSTSDSKQSEENQAFIFTCPFCFARCKEADELKDHLASHVEVKIVDKTQETKKEEHRCGECEKAFDSLEQLETHQQVHKLKQETDEFQCPICGKHCHTKTGLANHQGVHELDKLQCGECKQYFMDEENLIKHFKEHITNIKEDDVEESKPTSMENEHIVKTPDGYKCSFCDKVFKRRHRLISHLRTHTGEKPYQCKTCLLSFSQKYRLICHERIHRGDQPYKCTECDKSFTLRSGLRQHVLLHTGEKPYSCIHCGQKFRLRSGLAVHQSIHITTRNFKCPQCVKCFKIRRSLNRHVARVHVSGRYGCKECGDSFSTKTRLTSHEFMHKWEKERDLVHDDGDNDKEDPVEDSAAELEQGSVEKPHSIIRGKNSKKLECTYCHKPFKKPSVLMRHERIHTGEKPHKCRFCPKRCARKDGLIQHERIHTGEKPFVCRYCQASYRTMSGRNDHEKTHLKCTVCRREFRTVTACESHEKTHNEGHMFKCKKCTKSFSSQKYLVYHARIHDVKSEIHECEICGEAFGLKGKLSQHKMNAHGAMSLYQGADRASNTESEEVTEELKNSVMHQKGLVIDEFNGSDQLSSDAEKAQDDSSGDPPKNTGKSVNENKSNNQAAKPDAQSVRKKPHKCQYCGMMFDKACRRIAHERVHTGERPFRCDQCPRAFTLKDTLKRHQRTHAEGLPFPCDICKRAFKTRNHLNSHVRNFHEEKLSRSCEKCGKEFKSAQALTKHALVHSDGLVSTGDIYTCKFCPETFKRFRHFSNHLKNVHGKLDAEKGEADLSDSDAMDNEEHDGKDPDYEPESQDELDEKMIAKVHVKYYQCSSCVQKRTTIKGLELHERTHTDDRPYKCESCAEEFVREEMVKLHKEYGCKTDDSKQTKLDKDEMDDIPTQFQCTLCGNLFENESSLKYHKRSHGKKEFICAACGEKFPNKMTLKEHKKTHSINVFRNYYCTECPKSYMQKRSLEIHIETCHRDATRIKCEHCGETFVNDGWFKKHMFSYHHEILVAEQARKTHTDSNQAGSSQLIPQDVAAEVQVNLHHGSQVDPNNPDKVMHFDTLHVQSTMDCIETLAAFSSSLQGDALAEVADHVGIDRSDMVEVPINPINENVSHDSVGNLMNNSGVPRQVGDASNIQSETPELSQTSNQFNNNKANKKLPSKQTVATEKYKQAVVDPKTFICQWCSKAFKKGSQLRNHERTHTGETPYLCNLCGKGFKLLSGLKDHEDRHKGVKKYKCSECPKAYSNPSALQEHLDAHRGIKRYQCAECPKSYRQHQSLKEHMDVHRGFRKYQCDTCPRSFSQRRCWRIHMRTHGKTV